VSRPQGGIYPAWGVNPRTRAASTAPQPARSAGPPGLGDLPRPLPPGVDTQAGQIAPCGRGRAPPLRQPPV